MDDGTIRPAVGAELILVKIHQQVYLAFGSHAFERSRISPS
jgi:hypothetical protein